MKEQLLIGLIGKKRAGKDTFAAVLTERHGYEKVAFADPLREAALALDPIVHVEIDKNGEPDVMRYSEALEAFGYEKAKDLFPEVRTVLQRLGTDSIRALDAGFWVRAAMDRVAKIDGPVVVTDVRFPNEANAIRNAGGKLIRITRHAQPGDDHPTETALDDYQEDYTVPNLASKDALEAVADRFGNAAIL